MTPGVALPLLTQSIAETYRQFPTPTTFLRNFYRVIKTDAYAITWAVERVAALKATDILLNQTGNKNEVTQATLKTVLPKLYDESCNLTDMDKLWHLFNSNNISDSQIQDVNDAIAKQMLTMRNKIERAKEYDRLQAILTGTVTYDATGIQVDYGRRAGSFIDTGAGTYWATSTVNPMNQIGEMVDYIRKTGYAGIEGGNMSNVYICIMGETAFADFKQNAIFLQMNRDLYGRLNDIKMPELDAMGGTRQGTYSVGSNIVAVYTYPTFYVPDITAPATVTDYMDPKQVIVIPSGISFTQHEAGIPALPPSLVPSSSGIMIPSGFSAAKDYYYYSYVSDNGRQWVNGVMSRPMSVPTKIDCICTRKVVA